MRARFFTTRIPGGKLALLLLLAVLLPGCTTDKRHKVLSFFFDGVPDPNAEEVAQAGAVRRTTSGVVYFFHEPYHEGNCEGCHQAENVGMIGRANVAPDACRKCHGDVAASYRYVHGPVAAMACSQCHEPHRSRGPHLLRNQPRELCLSCHDQRELSIGIAQHHEPEASCLSCHSGHGGHDRNLLKTNYIRNDQ